MKELIKTVDEAIRLLSEENNINMRSIAFGLKMAVEGARVEADKLDSIKELFPDFLEHGREWKEKAEKWDKYGHLAQETHYEGENKND